MLVLGRLWGTDLHQLDLLKLMLPQEAPGVSPVGPSLSSEGRRGAHHSQRKLRAVEYLAAEEVSDWDLSGRDQERIFPAHGMTHFKEVFLELRKLA